MLKISGEALAGEKKLGLDTDTINEISRNIKEVYDLGVEIAIVVGVGISGEVEAGKDGPNHGGLYGHVGTVINALGLQDALESQGMPTRVQTAIEMRQIAEPYIRRKAVRHLEKKRIVIFACGTGNPFFSTDTTAALRAAEIDAEVILLAKKVDGVYDSDPNINPNAKKFDKLSFMDVINKGLGVMDSTAASLCKDNNIPIIVFGLNEPGNIVKAVMGEKIGTIVM